MDPETALREVTKGLPILVGLAVHFLVPRFIRGTTRDHAFTEQLLMKNEQDQPREDQTEALASLLDWRGSILGLLTGLFVLQYAAAQDIRDNTWIGFAATLVVIVIFPVTVLVVCFLPGWLKPAHLLKPLLSWTIGLATTTLYLSSTIFVYL